MLLYLNLKCLYSIVWLEGDFCVEVLLELRIIVLLGTLR